MEAALIISSFRRKNQQAGFVFREPPGVSEIIETIDKLVNTDTPVTRARKVRITKHRARKIPEGRAVTESEAGRAMLAQLIASV